jgi:D-alanine-D-alanine ligase-like ATP-grasp enzyme
MPQQFAPAGRYSKMLRRIPEMCARCVSWISDSILCGHLLGRVDQETAETAIRAAEAIGIEIAGFDQITIENEPCVIEVKASPGFRALLSATGINAAQKIAEYAISKAK